MKFAFNTANWTRSDIATICARAREWGYDGVELDGDFIESAVAISDACGAAGIAIACLTAPVSMTGDRRGDDEQAGRLPAYLDLAVKLNCPMVKIQDVHVTPGQRRNVSDLALAQWLAPLVENACDRGITLVIENAPGFRRAKDLWIILESISHPSLGVCWDIFNATVAGEAPGISVPTLNSRIQYARVCDAIFTGGAGAEARNLGEGSVPVRKFLIRLMGIGYGGWITVRHTPANQAAKPEEYLRDAIGKLKQWTTAIVKPARRLHPAKP